MNTLESIEVKGNGSFRDLYILLKPRVMWLAVFTAAVGMFIAPDQNDLFISFITLLCISIGAGAAGVLNMWWDKELDHKMERTSGRPLPNDKIKATSVGAYDLIKKAKVFIFHAFLVSKK